jgi:hypothetical protein
MAYGSTILSTRFGKSPNNLFRFIQILDKLFELNAPYSEPSRRDQVQAFCDAITAPGI